MESYIGIFLFIFVVLAFVFGYSFSARKKEIEREYKRIVNSFGSIPENEYLDEKYDSIQNYYRQIYSELEKTGDYCNVDDITWHDLDFDSIYMLINNTQSSIGEEYLYSLLRTPVLKKEILEERERLIDFFGKNSDKRIALQRKLAVAGKMIKISVYEYIGRLNSLEDESNTGHYIKFALIILSFLSIFINPAFGIGCTVIMFFVNVISYFKRKGQIEKYYSVVAYILRTTDCALDISRLDIPEIRDYLNKLKENSERFSKTTRGGRMIVSKSNSGDIIETLLDYLRMASHIDLIRFNNMLKGIRSHIDEFRNIYETIGLLDSMIAAASYRKLKGDYCIPELIEDFDGLNTENIFHPLISEPVKNNFDEKKSVLLTGSNASGKSTFIKTVAINMILAQTIHTVCADRYKAPFYKCMTSMALADNLSEGESYYIVEIKSLKRICDALNPDVRLLVFIDEVLRGTNTLERIAASSQILKYISQRNCMLFAATHDIELTQLLSDNFVMYHFEEKIRDGQVLFDYILKTGPAKTRNAIKLLDMLGFENEITEKASEQADLFCRDGEWSIV